MANISKILEKISPLAIHLRPQSLPLQNGNKLNNFAVTRKLHLSEKNRTEKHMPFQENYGAGE